MDRVDFEELALHSVDASLGPQATNAGQPNVSYDEKDKRSVCSVIHASESLQ